MAVQISRADVSSDEILDLQSETRFLKLPTDPYLDLLGVVTSITIAGSNYKCDQQSEVSFCMCIAQYQGDKVKHTSQTLSGNLYH